MQKTVAKKFDPFASYCASKLCKISASNNSAFLPIFCRFLSFSCVYSITKSNLDKKTNRITRNFWIRCKKPIWKILKTWFLVSIRKNLPFSLYIQQKLANIVLVLPSAHIKFMFSGSIEHLWENIKKLSRHT